MSHVAAHLAFHEQILFIEPSSYDVKDSKVASYIGYIRITPSFRKRNLLFMPLTFSVNIVSVRSALHIMPITIIL